MSINRTGYRILEVTQDEEYGDGSTATCTTYTVQKCNSVRDPIPTKVWVNINTGIVDIEQARKYLATRVALTTRTSKVVT